MDYWTVVRTILEKNPGIRAKELITKLRGRIGLSRSSIYEHLGSLELKGRIEREKGRYYLTGHKPLSTSLALEREDALSHSVLLIPALERIAHLYEMSCYYDVEEDRKEGDPFFNNDCAREHLRAYPNIWSLFERRDSAIQKAQEIRETLYTRIIQRLRKEFPEEQILALPRFALSSYLSSKIPMVIASKIREKTKAKVVVEEHRWNVGGEIITHYILLVNNDGVGRGRELSDKLEKFINCEIEKRENIEAVAQIVEKTAESRQLLKILQPEVKKLIAKIRHRKALDGNCEICSKYSF
jgi:hypothetical protein